MYITITCVNYVTLIDDNCLLSYAMQVQVLVNDAMLVIDGVISHLDYITWDHTLS